jgi:hypothetical protein
VNGYLQRFVNLKSTGLASAESHEADSVVTSNVGRGHPSSAAALLQSVDGLIGPIGNGSYNEMPVSRIPESGRGYKSFSEQFLMSRGDTQKP